MTTKLFTLATASALACALTVSPTWANPEGGYGGHGGGYEKGRHGMGAAMMEMMMHGGAGHLIRHFLKHEKDIGLSADQVTKLKEMQLNLDKNRIKMEADIQVAERELKALNEDEKTDLGAIEAKLKQSGDLQIGLRLLSIKTRREATALLTPEQRTKQQAEHDKVMQQHKGGYDSPHKKTPHGGNPSGANPHGQAKPQ
jgi:Spy/CpxP family protein refolding chaperone